MNVDEYLREQVAHSIQHSAETAAQNAASIERRAQGMEP